jgi:hypothetical protein
MGQDRRLQPTGGSPLQTEEGADDTRCEHQGGVACRRRRQGVDRRGAHDRVLGVQGRVEGAPEEHLLTQPVRERRRQHHRRATLLREHQHVADRSIEDGDSAHDERTPVEEAERAQSGGDRRDDRAAELPVAALDPAEVQGTREQASQGPRRGHRPGESVELLGGRLGRQTHTEQAGAEDRGGRNDPPAS